MCHGRMPRPCSRCQPVSLSLSLPGGARTTVGCQGLLCFLSKFMVGHDQTEKNVDLRSGSPTYQLDMTSGNLFTSPEPHFPLYLK